MNKIRQQLRFKGRVQGVGFRYTANQIAQKLGITGWVYNDYDGSVLMEAQGTKSQISQMINLLEKGTFIEIDSIDKIDLQIEQNEQRIINMNQRIEIAKQKRMYQFENEKRLCACVCCSGCFRFHVNH